jgi:hypothetical protein
MPRRIGLALVLAVSTSSAVATLKVIGTAPGALVGELSYAAGQYWLTSGREELCIMVEAPDEAALEPLVGQKISFTGPIQTWSDRSRCIVVGPDFPKPADTASRPRAMPVMIGAHGQPELDACLSIGALAAPAALRSAPDPAAGTSAQLLAGQTVHLCGASADGAWESIVVPPRAGQDCGVSAAVATPRPYAGPCKAGWVPAGDVEVLAG